MLITKDNIKESLGEIIHKCVDYYANSLLSYGDDCTTIEFDITKKEGGVVSYSLFLETYEHDYEDTDDIVYNEHISILDRGTYIQCSGDSGVVFKSEATISRLDLVLEKFVNNVIVTVLDMPAYVESFGVSEIIVANYGVMIKEIGEKGMKNKK